MPDKVGLMKSLIILAASITVIGVLRVDAEVTGLINTGTDGNGSLLPVGSIQGGWTITAVTPPQPAGGLSPSDPPSSAFVVDPYLNWMSSSSPASGWISYQYPLYTGGDVSRQFTYALTFTAGSGGTFLTRMAGDNGVSLFLNNTTSFVADWGFDPSSGLHFQSWSPWVEVSGFSSGENTLLFVVDNLSGGDGNPTGLRVEFAAIPEPSVLAFCAIALAACWIRRG